ncbi:hypothetical protein CRG98_005929 [Punica granatum]|uniref:Uncharacterized protein n=1 Tax=Punica granatum TaxID=22663 RepID=A0A2I0KYY9_PUNGR|nr:hypothetical protein CRG98_005929 [Punica granatum]
MAGNNEFDHLSASLLGFLFCCRVGLRVLRTAGSTFYRRQQLRSGNDEFDLREDSRKSRASSEGVSRSLIWDSGQLLLCSLAQ